MSTIIETDRLILRKFTLEDFKDVYEFGSNKEVLKYTGDNGVESFEDAKDLIRNVWFEDYKKYGYGRWATIYKPDNKLIGFAGLKFLPELDETDIGYRFLPEYWGKGIATEASKEIVAYGFHNLDLKTIIGMAIPENIASCNVLTKIGLRLYKTGPLEGEKEELNWYKIEHDNDMYQTGA